MILVYNNTFKHPGYVRHCWILPQIPPERKSTPKNLGSFFSAKVDQAVGNMRIEKTEKVHITVAMWRVVKNIK